MLLVFGLESLVTSTPWKTSVLELFQKLHVGGGHDEGYMEYLSDHLFNMLRTEESSAEMYA